jgi:glycosyltransferase involved in cell wall biosynthesis
MNKIQESPLVSIIIPVYNGSNYLSQAIDSALKQTYKNIEIIVVNDGSNDNGATENIALDYKDHIIYYKKENGGVASALNLGIEKMSGKYFSWLSHDDLFLEHKIDKQISEIMKHQKNTIIYSDFNVFTTHPENSQRINLPSMPHENFRYWITVANSLHGCTLLIPKAAFDKYGLFDTALKTTQDYLMWFNFAKDYNFIHIPDTTVLARSHPEQGTKVMPEIVKHECDALITHFINELQPNEILHSTKKDLYSSYIEISRSCFNRGFTNAHLRAIELANSYKRETMHTENLICNNTTLYQKIRSVLKKIISFLLPKRLYNILINCLSKVRSRQENLKQKISLQDKFTNVYRYNLFEGSESRSGEGSDLVQTEVIRQAIPKLIKNYNIASFLDAPCGDWYWMCNVKLGVKKYIGVDIVQEMIDKNNKTYGNDITSFQKLDLVTDQIPKTDLIFSRDCLVHLNYEHIFKILKSFKKSGATYLLTTTFTNRIENSDLYDNMFWRTLNMQKHPFNFPAPLVLINENCTEDKGNYNDKCLGLWLLKDISL